MNLGLVVFLISLAVGSYASYRCDLLDVETGRRDTITYGSNRGWYWPWSPLCALAFFTGVLSIFPMILGARQLTEAQLRALLPGFSLPVSEPACVNCEQWEIEPSMGAGIGICIGRCAATKSDFKCTAYSRILRTPITEAGRTALADDGVKQ